MFAKVFSQIFDSTIANNWKDRHVFMDLLVLADADGCVNMTLDAISRRTNVPLEMVSNSVHALCEPDPDSQNKECAGRRLVALEEGRGWGWRIVSYAHYRAIRDAEDRRAYHRDYYATTRKPKKKAGKNGDAKPKKKRRDPYALYKHPAHSGKPLLAKDSPFLDPDRLGPPEPPE